MEPMFGGIFGAIFFIVAIYFLWPILWRLAVIAGVLVAIAAVVGWLSGNPLF
jgi:hypothetical protein